MNKNTHTLTIRIPEDLKYRLEKNANKQGVSINQLALYMFTKELSELETSNFFNQIIKDKSKKEIFDSIDNILSSVPAKKSSPEWDKI